MRTYTRSLSLARRPGEPFLTREPGQGLLSRLGEDVGTTLLPLLNAGKGCTDHPACCVWTLLAQNMRTHTRSLSLSEGSTNTCARSPSKNISAVPKNDLERRVSRLYNLRTRPPPPRRRLKKAEAKRFEQLYAGLRDARKLGLV
jgi:hypothetical protein